ncbi:MAG TPA: hypothetical protein ENG60_04685, partial [Thermoplasmatales archaeon]|nr:hypothetical protein [Thermoplasmatales archaeon]HEX17686.1 hypothetical protein [Thermoplasmatales archaeon]
MKALLTTLVACLFLVSIPMETFSVRIADRGESEVTKTDGDTVTRLLDTLSLPYLPRLGLKDHTDLILEKLSGLIKAWMNQTNALPSIEKSIPRLIVKLRPSGSGERLSKMLDSAINTKFLMETIFSNIYAVTFLDDIDLSRVIDVLKAFPSVEYVEIDQVCKLMSTYPNDPLFPQQWSLNSSTDHDIDAPEAWDYERGDKEVVIAVIDTGVDYYHPDLASNIWINSDEIPGNGIDDDNNGYIDDINGWNFIFNDSLAFDGNGHGTGCAGIIGAVGNNSKDIAGICWNCSIMPVKCFPDTGVTSFASIVAKGIVYAVDNGADIISMSFGTYGDSRVLRDAIRYAYGKGVILIAAAGNDNTSLKSYPAGYPEVISVGATDEQDKKADFSNYGSWIDVAAPGDQILSLAPYNNTQQMTGTSAACAHVAGISALLMSFNDSVDAEVIRTLLKSGAEKIDSSVYVGVGRVNAFRSLQIFADVVSRLNESLDDAVVSGSVVEIYGTASGNNFSNYTLYYGAGIYPSSWNKICSSSSKVEDGLLGIWNISTLPDGVYTIKLSVRGDSGYYYNDTAVLTINNAINIWHVGGGGAGNLSTIREAVHNSGDGDTIYVHPGVYRESIIVDRGISIVGEDRGSTIVMQPSSAPFSLLPAFYISHDGVVIDNFSISGAIAIVCEDVRDVTISNNTISSLLGIALVSSEDIVIEHNLISNVTSIPGGVGILALPFGMGALFDPSVMFPWIYSSHHFYGGL